MGFLSTWRATTGAPFDAVSTWTCPRCGEQVEMRGLGRGRGQGQLVWYRPTIAAVVTACGCRVAGRPAVPEWPARKRRRFATWYGS